MISIKKIVFVFIIFLVVFFIYKFNINNKIYYLSIGDYLSYGLDNFENTDNGYSAIIKDKYKKNLQKYVNYSSDDDYRVNDLINDINDNKEVNYNNKEYKIQNLLIKANLITISIGMNDILYKNKISYEYLDSLIYDMDRLLILIRKYNKDKIYILGFYDIINNNDFIEYTNKRLKDICERNNVIYVDISNLSNYIIKDRYPTKEGYLYISNQILNFTK